MFRSQVGWRGWDGMVGGLSVNSDFSALHFTLCAFGGGC